MVAFAAALMIVLGRGLVGLVVELGWKEGLREVQGLE